VDDRGTLGERIARFRKKRGLSQDELASELDVTRSIVSAWENDRRRPRRDKLAALDAALGTTDEFVSWPLDHESDDATPVLEAPIPIGRLQRDVASALARCLSTGEPAATGPGYGWNQNLDDAGRPASAMATAYGVRTLLMNGGGGWQLDLARIRAQLRALESPDGGWSPFTSTAPARPEVTAAVVAALRASGEDEGYVRGRIGLLLEMLAQRAAIQRFERPYVLAASLHVLSRLPVDDAAVRRFVDDLVDMSTLDDDGRWWPVVVKPAALAPPPSTAHTARAVCALAHWAERTGDAAMLDAAEAGRRWLERHAAFDLEYEVILTARSDGGEEPLPVKHFTPAWVLRAVVAAGGDPDALTVRRALRATVAFYSPEVALWRWPSDGGILPVWMSYHGLVSLATWALARRID
jgi:transcriptional regulator with XRE-family HTH domain